MNVLTVVIAVVLYICLLCKDKFHSGWRWWGNDADNNSNNKC